MPKYLCLLCTGEEGRRAGTSFAIPKLDLRYLGLQFTSELICIWSAAECGRMLEDVMLNAAHKDLTWSQCGVKAEQLVNPTEN